MPTTSRASSTFARSRGREEPCEPTQNRPSEHAEPSKQFQGFFRGLGVTSKEPICNKRATELGRVHQAAHFAIGCQKWDDGIRGLSTTHMAYSDPQVIYATCDAPDKNASVVELRQIRFNPDAHYRTEQREQYEDPGAQPLDEPFRKPVTVFLGDDEPELITQFGLAHCRPADADARRAARFRAAGSGTLVPTSLWPKGVRSNPIHGGPRALDGHDLGIQNGLDWKRISANSSAIVEEAHIRNPILGHHVPLSAYAAPSMRTTSQILCEHNASVPPLRSLGSLRPHEQPMSAR